jgi:hypothetical protein
VFFFLGLLFGGPLGQDYLNLTICAWSKFVPLTLPVLVVYILAIVLCWPMQYFKQKFLSPTVETMNLTNKPKPSLGNVFILNPMSFNFARGRLFILFDFKTIWGLVCMSPRNFGYFLPIREIILKI